jgi:hypothetical protein
MFGRVSSFHQVILLLSSGPKYLLRTRQNQFLVYQCYQRQGCSPYLYKQTMNRYLTYKSIKTLILLAIVHLIWCTEQGTLFTKAGLEGGLLSAEFNTNSICRWRAKLLQIWGTKGCGGWEAIPSVQQPSSDPAMLHHDLHPSTQGGGVGPPAVATTLQKIVSRAKLIF